MNERNKLSFRRTSEGEQTFVRLLVQWILKFLHVRKNIFFQQGAAALPAIMALAMILLLTGLAILTSALLKN